ncbi:hypothetical protein WMF31_34355 [Sorangium sp. So ce1036]|uniref:hypothetical protein n=1 Tax=Sorangium sp. So ce1036 TaxID=3133328 RepID=UPI003EFC9175
MRRLPRGITVVLAAIAAFLLLGFVLFSAPGHDDSHITYWAAHTLKELGQILNYNGERVEQSSSLAHVVLLALLGALTRVPLPTLGPLTSIAAGVLAIALVARLARAAVPGAPRGAELLVATASWFVYWGFGGLESTLVAAAAAWLVLELDRYLVAPGRRALLRFAGASLFFLCARPESPLVIACVLAASLVYCLYRQRWADPAQGRWREARAALVACAVAGAESAILFGARRLYFGAFFPNPVYSKAAGIDVADGLSYLWKHLYPTGLGLIAGVALGLSQITRAALRREPRHAAVLSAAFTVAYVAFIVLTGGDWMTGGRFIAHGLPLMVVVTMAGLSATLGAARRVRIALVPLVAANLVGVVMLADSRSSGRPLWSTFGLREALRAQIGEHGYTWFELANKTHLRDTTIAAVVLDAMREIKQKRPDHRFVVMSSQAGMTAYHVFKEHYGSAELIDTCSLSTRELLTCLPPGVLSRRRIGMVLHFRTYFAKQKMIDARCGTRRPDIVFDHSGRGVEAILERNGYSIVYRQHGRIKNEGLGRWFRTSVPSDTFVAIDKTLLAGTSFEGKRTRHRWKIQ